MFFAGKSDKELAEELVVAIKAIEDNPDLDDRVKMTALSSMYIFGWMASNRREVLAAAMLGTIHEFEKRRPRE